MTAYTGVVPDTRRRAPHWLTSASCRAEGVHPDEMFPDNNATLIEHAKSICRACPVLDSCLADALRTGDNQWGIRAALTPKERQRLTRQPETRRAGTPRAKTLTEAFARRVSRTSDGHVAWSGSEELKFGGVAYTPAQAAFIVGHGREPEGRVRRTCGLACYRADHLIDGRMRDEGALCGTRKGYRLHGERGEKACAPCRQANTDASNRLRRTGTTRALT